MAVHLVHAIDTGDFGAEALRIGDLNGDGAPDLLLVQSVYGTRAITCLTAVTFSGKVLWQTGVPNRDNGSTYSDLPVQIYDWDNDGRNEVLYVRQAEYVGANPWGGYARERADEYRGHAEMIVLDGLTGKKKGSFPLPAPADDCFLFADLTGRGRREDLVVKDRYWNMWGIAHSGEELWHWAGSPGHFPAIGDVDSDGRDEVFVGFALIDHDGRVLFSKDPAGHHQDAACAVRLADGSWRLLFGNHGAHCLAADGTELWYYPLPEAQHVVPGRFRFDSELQFMVINRGEARPAGGREPATLYLYDLQGREIWRRVQPEGSWCAACVRINWFGPGAPDAILVYSRNQIIMYPQGNEQRYGRIPGNPDAIYDGNGTVVDTLELPLPPNATEELRRTPYYCLAADVAGDSRDEVIMAGARSAWVFANARPLALPTLYNETLYPGV